MALNRAPAAAAHGPTAEAAREPPPRYASPVAAMKNAQAVGFVRGFFSSLVAVAIGILGVSGTWGFIAYIVAHLLSSGALLLRMKAAPSAYFHQQGPLGFLTSGLAENLLLFVFLWTLAYAIVHIY